MALVSKSKVNYKFHCLRVNICTGQFIADLVGGSDGISHTKYICTFV